MHHHVTISISSRPINDGNLILPHRHTLGIIEISTEEILDDVGINTTEPIIVETDRDFLCTDYDAK